jgi:hypothetical protein
MAVKRTQIATLDQAYDYAEGSAKAAAAGVCPSQTGTYQQLAARVTAGAYGIDALDKALWSSALLDADAMCKNAPDYAGKTGKATAPAGTPSPLPKVDPATGGAAPEVAPDIMKRAGIPWWVWLAGGIALYFIAKK